MNAFSIKLESQPWTEGVRARERYSSAFQGRSYNQPKFCLDASWNPNGITFANSSTVGAWPFPVFVTTDNSVVIADRSNSRIHIWRNGSASPTTLSIPSLSGGLWALFVTTNDEIYINNGQGVQSRVERWTFDGTQLPSVMSICSACYSVFVDISGSLYCSQYDHHKVVSTSLSSTTGTLTIVAGTGYSGDSRTKLNNPFGIFINVDLELYVADAANDRIQIFHPGQLNGTTVAGTGAAGTISLWFPTGIVLDGDGYMFIVDSYHHRIVRASSDGFLCVVGCSGPGNASNQLLVPKTLSLDSDGNMFVADSQNNRIQKFVLSRNSCGKIHNTKASNRI